MAEGGFHVEPGALVGYASLCSDTGDDVERIAEFVTNNAGSDSGFSGLVMGAFAGPVDDYAESTKQRLGDRTVTLADTTDGLNDAAWTYTNLDAGSESDLLHLLSGPPRPADWPPPNPYSPYSRTEDPTRHLIVSDLPEANIATLLAEHGGKTITYIDDICRKATAAIPGVDEWSPVEAIVEPLIGNWNGFIQKGHALRHAGNAADAAAGNLTSALPTLDPHWDGAAAEAFSAYVGRLAAAMTYEGALNRVIGKVYETFALMIRETAAFAVEVLNFLVEKLRKYAMGTGWLELAGRTVWNVFSHFDVTEFWNTAKREVQEILAKVEEVQREIEEARSMVDDFVEFIEMAKDPIGALDAKITELTQPILETIQVAAEIQQTGEDLATLADPTALTNAPTTGYNVGDDPFEVES